MKTLHKALLQLRKDWETHSLYAPRGGICVHLSIEHEDGIQALFPLWPEYSGDVSYPVPHTADSHHAYYEFAEGKSAEAMWYEGEYAAARVRLLDFLIEQTK